MLSQGIAFDSTVVAAVMREKTEDEQHRETIKRNKDIDVGFRKMIESTIKWVAKWHFIGFDGVALLTVNRNPPFVC